MLTLQIEQMSEEYDVTASEVQQKTMKFCEDGVDVNGELRKEEYDHYGTNKAECWLNEGEKKRR